MIVAGDSAGGNLAAAVCLRRKASRAPMPIGQVLIYPGLGGDPASGSYIENAEAPLLRTDEALAYFRIMSGGQERSAVTNPDIIPLKACDFSDLPPAYIVSADMIRCAMMQGNMLMPSATPAASRPIVTNHNSSMAICARG